MKFKSWIIVKRTIALAGVLASISAYGQAPKSAKAPESPKKCLMWKAVSGTNVVYLLGSIHLGSKKMYPLPSVVEDAYKRSKVLVVEVDINAVDKGEAMEFVSSNGMYAGDDNLWKHLSKATADKVRSFCAKYTSEPAMLTTIGMSKPWLASIFLEVLPMQQMGMNPNLGIDKYFLDRAPNTKPPKKIVQVETADFQLKLLSSLPEKLSDEYLSYSLGESSKAVEEDSKLEKLWMQGDAKALDDAISSCPPDLVPIMRQMREDRNPHMADVAEKYLKGGGPCFFVVGAAHLVGKEGVIAILQKRGYSIFQVDAGKRPPVFGYAPKPENK